MIRLSLALALAALAVPALAAAKEPSQASISGPGFSKTLTLKAKDFDNFSGSKLAELTEASGFFPSAVGQSPNPMLPGRPAGKLGPRYTIVWTVPATTTHRVRQDLYPYARGGAVTYTRPGQPIFDTRTRGGWYRNPMLKETLVGIGLPAHAPQGSSGTGYALPLGIGIPVLLAGAAGIALLARRRRARPDSGRPEVALD